MPIPPTRNNLNAMECLSALQKHIRRAEERPAMEIACELLHTSRGFCSMLCKRLIVVCLEDVDNLAQPSILPYVYSATTLAKEWWHPDPRKQGKSRLAVANVVLMLSRAKKSRLADHFQCATAWRALLEGHVPSIPDFALDGHTQKGKRLGRGIEYFRTVSTQLVPPPAERDQYEDEAYRLWRLKETRGVSSATGQAELEIDAEDQ